MGLLGSSGDHYGNIALLGIYLFVLVCIFWLLVYATLIKPEWTIDTLKLESGIIEEKLNINMHRSSILAIVIMIIGGITLTDTLPALCRDSFFIIQESHAFTSIKDAPTISTIVFNLIKIAFAIFMLTSPRVIVNYIEKKRRQPVENKITE